ncbi:hypothetical protein [Paenibacillus sp. LPE1-1-1.1]|uniref:hypothetical protein n=1 Tax=Paenibacillus sp. LPE1-1-1.1 TaxID=3135230 RepID=UPI003419AB7C
MSSQTAIRYVITPDHLAHITLLSTGRSLVVQAPYFRKLLDINPRTTLGSTSIDHAQLRMLGVIPSREEVSTNDSRVTISA